MAYFKSESNNFCESKKIKLSAGGSATGIQPTRHILGKVNPYKLNGVSVQFASAASGNFIVKAKKSGVELTVIDQEVSSNSSVVITDINLWLSENDSISAENSTGSAATAIFDFNY